MSHLTIDIGFAVCYNENMVIKKKSIANLIKAYAEHDDEAFRKEALQIIHAMSSDGDKETSYYLTSLLTDSNTFTPQDYELAPDFFSKVPEAKESLYLPDSIKEDLLGIANILSADRGIHKIIFYGAPGTGKTEAVKQLARITQRRVYVADFNRVIDSKLGQTAKNIATLFEELNNILNPNRFLVLFDELDAIALNRIDRQDIREMGRATTEILKGLDLLSKKITIIATTNLYRELDTALRRRFDLAIDFDRYNNDDYIEVSQNILSETLSQFNIRTSNREITKKIFGIEPVMTPGEVKNIIRAAVAFSDPKSNRDYLSKLVERLSSGRHKATPEYLSKKGFTLREIEAITGISKSTLSRRLRETKV